jgi:nitrogen-specific signal transduction histidine kinase/ActR/RegA family two-component response regulator
MLGFPRFALLAPTLLAWTGGIRHFAPARSSNAPRTTGDDSFAPFFETSEDPMVILDDTLRILDANPAAARFLHTSADRLRGTAALEADLLARLLTAASIPQRLRTDPAPVVDEVAVTDREGQAIQTRIEAVPLPAGRTLVHLRDTSALLRARATLHAADALHRAIFDALPAVCWAMALPEERLIEVSAAVERVFGYQPADFRQRPELWDEVVHPAERERVRGEFRVGIAAGRPFEIHFTGLHSDHRDLPHLVNRVVPVSDERGWVDHCEGFIEDLGAQRTLEQTLRATQANLKHTLEAVSSGVLVVRPADQGPAVTLCNRRLSEMMRLDAPVKPGTPLAILPETLRQLVQGAGSEAEFDRQLLSDDVKDEVVELTDPVRVLHRYAGPLRDELGQVVGRIVTVEDVTTSWQMQRQLTHSQKMESMGRLAGGVAHDFNNLLGTILGFSSLLLEQIAADDPRRASLEQIAQAAERASNLTAALLAFSRSARFERTPLSLNRVIEDSYQLVRSAIDPGVSIVINLEPALPTLLGDSLLLQQLVVNLVQEVRPRLGTAGTLRLSTRAFDQAVPAELQETEGHLRRVVAVEIQATPGGTPGPRVAAPGTPAAAGEPTAGLALTIAEDIARAHGGFLVRQMWGERASFEVTFPAERRPGPPALAHEVDSARGHETILVVDDEPGLRALARSGLRQRGFDVVAVESGEQALEILKQGEPHVDLVVLDLTMPGLSGEKVLRAIRAFRPQLPVLIASGYATVQNQSAWVAAGAAGFLAKPYRIRDLAGKLRDVLDRTAGTAS